MIEVIEKKSPEIFLVRCGRTELNSGEEGSLEKIRGWKDIPLSNLGKEDSKRVANKFIDIPIHRIYSSDLSRATDTAKEVSRITGSSFVTLKGLRPWNLGDIQGTLSFTSSELLKEYIRRYVYKSVKWGESFNTFKERAINTFNTILDEFENNRENIIIITHYRFIKIIQAWVSAGSVGYEIDFNIFMKNDIPPGSIMTITLDR